MNFRLLPVCTGLYATYYGSKSLYYNRTLNLTPTPTPTPIIKHNDIIKYPNGNKYSGRTINGVQDGFGELIVHEKNRDEIKLVRGNFYDNRIHGYCEVHYINGDIFYGDICLSEINSINRQGHCTYIYNNGNIFEGEYENNERIFGEMIFKSSGKIYQGSIKNFQAHGIGKWIFPNNSKYRAYNINGRIQKKI